MEKKEVRELRKNVINLTRLRESAGETKKSLVREVGGLFDMSTPMTRLDFFWWQMRLFYGAKMVVNECERERERGGVGSA